MQKIILVAGATGNLGFRIIKSLVNKNCEIRAIVRSNTSPEKINSLENLGVKIYSVNNWSKEELFPACKDVSCVISALAGLREVIIDAQKTLVDAAIQAKVPRFIPSDYSLDFTKFEHGENRNLDLRREFHTYLDKAPIAATSIFNGAFTDMLTGQMPVILFKQKLILYWGYVDYKWGFTTMDNTAEFTANVALESFSPRYLVIAGDQINANEIKKITEEVTGLKFKLFRPGGKLLLGTIIKIAKTLAPGKNELYPAWQGMQYMHNMIDERSRILNCDNSRFPKIKWITAKDVLVNYHNSIQNVKTY